MYPCEVGRGAAQDLDFHLRYRKPAAQLGPLRAGRAVPAALVDICAGDPAAQAAVAGAEVLHQLADPTPAAAPEASTLPPEEPPRRLSVAVRQNGALTPAGPPPWPRVGADGRPGALPSGPYFTSCPGTLSAPRSPPHGYQKTST